MTRRRNLTWADLAFGLLIAWSVVATGVAFRSQRIRSTPLEVRAQFVKDWQTYASRGFVRGPVRSALTIVVFSDFECPYCQRFAPVLDSLYELHPKVRIVERHFPIQQLHPSAFDAALSAECAADQGAYVQMRTELYTHQFLLERRDWSAIARDAHVPDIAQLAACVKSRVHADVVEADFNAGRRLGVRGTPAVLVNDTLLAHTPTLADLENRLRAVERL
jgi:protein-disulfide isomerase